MEILRLPDDNAFSRQKCDDDLHFPFSISHPLCPLLPHQKVLVVLVVVVTMRLLLCAPHATCRCEQPPTHAAGA